MRDDSPPSKASSTLCHRNGFTKSLESFARGVRFDRRLSFLDFPAKGNPLPKIRVLGSCRKSVAEKKKTSSPADRPSRDAAPWSPRDALPRECRAFFYRLLCLTLKRQAEDRWLDHVRPTGFRGERQGRSARKRPLRIYAARGLMCRELHEPVIFHRSISCKTKNTFQTIYFFQSFSTQLSTAFQDPRESALKQAVDGNFCADAVGRVFDLCCLICEIILFELMFDFDI